MSEVLQKYKNREDTIILESCFTDPRPFPLPHLIVRVWKDDCGVFWMEDFSKEDSKYEVMVMLGFFNPAMGGWFLEKAFVKEDMIEKIRVMDGSKYVYVWFSYKERTIKKITRDEQGENEIANLIFPFNHPIAEVVHGMVREEVTETVVRKRKRYHVRNKDGVVGIIDNHIIPVAEGQTETEWLESAGYEVVTTEYPTDTKPTQINDGVMLTASSVSINPTK